MAEDDLESTLSARKPSKPRSYYIDNLRTFLTFIVIIHHALITLAIGWFPLPPYPNQDSVFTLFYLCFANANQGYFMALFFFLAGLFAQRSLDRKGAMKFMIDRVLRLLVPIVFVYLFFSPLSFYICVIAGRVPQVSAQTPGAEIWRIFFSAYRLDHTWFLYNLFVFSTVFALFYRFPPIHKALTRTQTQKTPFTPLSAFTLLITCFVVLFPIAFLPRIVLPIGLWIPGIGQVAYTAPYVLFFSAGIVFQHRSIVDRIPVDAYMYLLPAMVMAFLALFGYRMYLAILGSYELILGGPKWQAVVDSCLEMFYMVFTSAFMVTFFRRFANVEPSPWWKRINEASYTVYLIQQIVILPATLIVYYIPSNPFVLWIVSSIISVPVVWLLAVAIKLIPKIQLVL
ncbi:acyltransferase 3 [Cladochytrium replicatum]|nr:acyltransferase 3 [Cladochytrium replicatum]